MQVSSYIFQSPYPSPVQFGRVDTSASSDKSSTATNTQADKATQPIMQRAPDFENLETQKTQEVAQSSDNLLNLYA